MNIFVLDRNPVIAAQQQCDKHVVKMILESGQMLSTAHRMLDATETRGPSKSGKTMVKKWVFEDDREDILYKAVHMYHPCTTWTMESMHNYRWHYLHFVALCDEYTYRYGKVHVTDTRLRKPLERLPDNIPSKRMTDFALAMKAFPDCITECAVESYQNYYHTKLAYMPMVWTKRKQPEWFNPEAYEKTHNKLDWVGEHWEKANAQI